MIYGKFWSEYWSSSHLGVVWRHIGVVLGHSVVVRSLFQWLRVLLGLLKVVWVHLGVVLIILEGLGSSWGDWKPSRSSLGHFGEF